jgi:hypothetical protein
MEQANENKNPNHNEKTRGKFHYGNLSLYQYKDPSGKTIQISRPAFIKIAND